MFFAFLKKNIEKLFYFGVDINHTIIHEQTMLYIIVRAKKFAIARYLLSKNVNVFIKNCKNHIAKTDIMTNNKQFL